VGISASKATLVVPQVLAAVKGWVLAMLARQLADFAWWRFHQASPALDQPD
jgi:hypothetical protein